MIALVDDTGTVILGEAAPLLTASVSLAGTAATITVSDKQNESNMIKYKKNADAALLGDDVSEWDELGADLKITAAAGDVISLAECGADGKAVASAAVTAE